MQVEKCLVLESVKCIIAFENGSARQPAFELGLTLSVMLSELSHDQDTIHAERGCVEMCNFCMAALMFLSGHGIKARTHAHNWKVIDTCMY